MSRLAVIVIFVIRAANLNNLARSYKIEILCCGGFRHNDFSIEIPQYGIKQSLNVAVAYGITIFELRKVYDQSIKKS